MVNREKVAIIGAGASGLVCAKVLLDDGFDVTLFERQRELGGIWSSERAYADLHSQQPGGTMEFSDLFDGEEYGSWQHVHNYLEKYADLFDIRKRIRFEIQVVSISKNDLKDGNTPWIIQTKRINDEKKETYEFDFVVIGTGLFSQPNIPIYKDQDKFAGAIKHPTEIKTTKQLENKRVIIVGCGKCATDMAVLAAKHARSCYLLFRRAHWMIPRKIVNGLLPAKVLYNPAFSAIFALPPNAPCSYLFRFIHEKFRIFFMKIADNIGNDILSIHGPDFSNDKIFIPQYSFRHIENTSIIPKDFIELKRQGRFIGKLGTIDQFLDETTVRLSTGEELQADMIIYATGFTHKLPFFSQKDIQLMGFTQINDNIQFNLYRHVIPVGVPNIAFIGYMNNTGYWMVAETVSHWISDYFLKRLKLPKTNNEMYQEIKQNQEFILNLFHKSTYDYRYYWLSPLQIYLNDMGLNLYRTNNWISEHFGIFRPNRLKGLHHERQILSLTGRKPTHFYFSFQLNILLFLFFIFVFFSFF